MSEQLANLYSATVQGGGYVHGSGTMVASTAVSGTQPTLGTFSITVLDGSGNVLLIFRVASVSGSTFTGVAEGPDADAPAGSIIVGTMLTVDSINQLFADHAGGGGFIQPLTTPVAGDFTALNFNTGTGVATTQSNNTSSISLLQHDPNTTQQMAALAKSKLASTFTIQLGMSMMGFPIGNNTPNQCIAGIWISDGGSPPNNIFWCLQGDNQGYRIPVFSDFSTFAGDILPQGSLNIEPLPQGPLLWFQIQETASARIYSLSGDGTLFFPVFSESNTAHFTTLDYGWACQNRSQPGNVLISAYSFVETNP